MGVNMEIDRVTLTGQSRLMAFEAGMIAALMLDHNISQAAAIKRALRNGKLAHVETVYNLVVTLGKQLVCDVLIDSQTTGLTYHAIGTGTTTPLAADTTLTTEAARKAFTTRTRSGNTISLAVFYLAAESTYNIKEGGVFGGSTASAAADSGTLFSHYLQSYDNSGGTYDLTFEYQLTVS